MRLKLTTLAAGAALLFTQFGLVSPAIAAATCVVDDFSDGVGSDADGSRTIRFCSSDISDQGTITFAHGGTTQLIEIQSSLSITGKVITIDGDELVTILRDSSATGSFSLLTSDNALNVDGMTFRDGQALGGGAINVGSNDIQVLRSQFFDNQATSDDGGAILASNAVIRNSIFTGNSTVDDGGATDLSSNSSEIRDSAFTNISAVDGGEIWS